jgi:hypothetical protein
MSEIEWYLDELFDQLAGTGAAGRRALMEAEYHLRATAADAMARGCRKTRPSMRRSADSVRLRWWPGSCAQPRAPAA